MTQLTTQNGEATTLSISQPMPMPLLQMEKYKALIDKASMAEKEDFEDVTPIYWEALQGESKVMVLLGFKEINKKDENTGEVIGRDFAVVFFDGSREVVCNQIALKDAMKSKNQGTAFKITCTYVAKKQAKKFEILELKS